MVEACCAREEAGMDGAEWGGGRWKKLHNRRHTPALLCVICCLVKLIGEGMLEMNWKENKLTLKQKYALSSLQLLVFNSEHNFSWRILWQNLFKYSKKSQTDLKSTIKVTIDKKVIL